MILFDWLFSRKSNTIQPTIRIGRYSDSYKSNTCYTAWENALSAFERFDYLECYRQFFLYLLDEQEQNIHWQEVNGEIKAVLIQGSQKVTINANETYFKAATHIARADALNIGLMRRLLEQNVQLSYGQYALSLDNELCIRFTTHAVDGSPYKLYYALKEIATLSDKQDNLLLDEFKNLRIVDETLRRPMPPDEQQVKYQFTIKTIQERLQLLDKSGLDFEQHSKAASYLMLDALFRIDYLVSPEGYVMEIIERAFRKFNENDGKNLVYKNIQLRKELVEILERPETEHIRELYYVNCTFGITTAATHDRLIELLNEHFSNAEWYEKNNHFAIAQAIYDYIVSFAYFSYALPRPDRDALRLYFQVNEHQYFKNLGFNYNYVDANGKIQKNEIEKQLHQIYQINKEKYPNAKFDIALLDCKDRLCFSKSFLKMLYQMDFSKE
jgi:hypothetical protein